MMFTQSVRTAKRRSFAIALLLTCIFATYLYGPSLIGSSDRPPPLSETPPGSVSQPPEQVPEQEKQQPEPAAPSQPAPARCPVTKVSMLYGAHVFPQLEQALDSHRRHCLRWGCGFENLDRDLAPNRRLFSKEYVLLATLLRELAKPEGERQEWVIWVDADSIILNPAISPCVFLPPEDLSHVYALVTADHQGLNNGVFYLKVSSESVELLTKIVAWPDAHPGEDLGWLGEQTAMSYVIDAIEAEHKGATDPSGIVWIPRTWINNYQFEHGFEGEPGALLVHFAGLGATRLTHMQNWLDELRDNQAKWEVPLVDTWYAKDVPDFWEAYVANVTGKS